MQMPSLRRLRTSRHAVSRVAAAVVAAAFLWPAQISAQQPALRDAAELELPTYPGWVFTPTLATGGTWDDNLLLAHADDTVLRDYGTSVQPSLRLDFRGRGTLLAANYDSSFLLYRDITEFNSSQQAFDFRFRRRITRNLTAVAHESFARVPTTDEFSVGGIPFYRIGGLTNDVGGGIEAALSRATVLDVAYTLTSMDFEFDQSLVSQLSGGYAHDGSLSLSHNVSERFTMGGRYQLRYAVLEGGADRFNIQDATITGKYLLTQSTELSGFVGVSRLDPGRRHSGHTGPSVGATLSRRLRRHVMLTADYQRNFIPSWGFGGTFENQEWRATVNVPFARNRGYLEARGTRLGAEALERGQPSMRSSWIGTTLGYRAKRWLSLELVYDQSWQNTNLPGGNRRRNILGFRLVTAKPMKLG